MKFLQSIGWESHIKPFLYKKLPENTGWGAVIGTLCALTFMLLVCTGVVLAFYYVPSLDMAYDSVRYISNDLPGGQMLRGLHHWGAGAMVLLVFIHLLVSYFHGSYMQPRQFTWVSGAILFLLVLGLGFTGYLLPWDMKAYWATIVGANIPQQYPVVGEYITRFILGGEGMSGFTLTRFYAIHTMFLPACIAVFMVVHIYLIRIHNLSDPRERIGGEKLPPETGKPYRFFPEHMYRTSIAFGILFTILLILAAVAPAQMEDRAGTFIADYLPRPEWYYMWLFQLLTYFTGIWEAVGSLLIPIGGVILLLTVPFISESSMKGMGNRPISLSIGLTFLVCVIYLTNQAYSAAEPYNKEIVVPASMLSAQENQGLRLFVEQECAYCHNIQGRGGHNTGPDMSNMKAKNREAAYLAEYIKDPVSKMASTTMPSYDLTPEELKALSVFLLALDFSDGEEPRVLDTEKVRKEIPNTLTKQEIPNTVTQQEIPNTVTQQEIPNTLTKQEMPNTVTQQ